jgi:hypothetical protein
MAKKQTVVTYTDQTDLIPNTVIFTPDVDGLYRLTSVVMVSSGPENAYPSLWGVNVKQADGSTFHRLALGVPCRVGLDDNSITDSNHVLYLKGGEDLKIRVDDTGPGNDGSFPYGTYSVYIHVEQLNAESTAAASK